MLLSVLLLAVGVLFLAKGADWLVDGGSSLARKFKISPIVIGLTIVAFGTSAPELVVNLAASFMGSTDIAIGNVLGSNVANVFLILGVCAIIYPLSVKKGTTWKEIPLSLLGAIVVGVLANDFLIDKGPVSEISRIDGIILLSFFAIFLVYSFSIAKEIPGKKEKSEIQEFGGWKTAGLIIIGLIGLTAGGELIVINAVKIAKYFGMSEFFIGITIVAVGTSLPELAASAVAAYKKQSDIAVGNIVGSNLFNVFFVLGTSATIKSLPFNISQNVDVLFAILASFMLFLWMFIGKKHILERWNGIVLVGMYVAYVG
ncbi:MAG: calcium/sodium antiporter, partial [Candidatus Gracilibacteria bacterium]|nr:calcium/sodium antiporter [Candidatus Gracilibacteria bacterium]